MLALNSFEFQAKEGEEIGRMIWRLAQARCRSHRPKAHLIRERKPGENVAGRSKQGANRVVFRYSVASSCGTPAIEFQQSTQALMAFNLSCRRRTAIKRYN